MQSDRVHPGDRTPGDRTRDDDRRERYVLPDHGGRCVSSIVPALLSGWPNELIPADVVDAPAVVVLVVDGLGWEQLQRFGASVPYLANASGQRITTVAPSTTATALTSITTGAAPGEHGVVGYRVRTAEGVLNCLRWSAGGGDARASLPPHELQPIEPFLGQSPPVVTRAEFADTGFTDAHLREGTWHGWFTPFTLVSQVAERVRAGDRFVYSYYDGLDKVGHVHGVDQSSHYLDELQFVETLVERLVSALPPGVELLVTADHGMVEVGDRLRQVCPEALSLTASTSGEARFMWLHARQGAAADLLEAAAPHSDDGWVVGIEQVLDEGWFGPVVNHEARMRLGDVALVAREPIAFVEPNTSDGSWLVGRHGGLTAEEMYVPLLRYSAG
ncbi:MAG: alkaline phosphatase family protein [Actinomycetota bacterium]|nr:alkaline phosphatase family protein [Actinomycetota bacterium]